MNFKTICNNNCKIANFTKTSYRLVGTYKHKMANLMYKFTSATGNKFKKCPECGLWYFSTRENQLFCSHNCSNKYVGRKRHERILRQTFKVIKNNDIKEWLKKYNNFVYSEIFKCDSELHEEMIDIYNEYLPRLVYLTRNSTNAIPYLKKVMKNIKLRALKNKQNEVFYDECSVKTQIQILGEYNER